MEKGNFNYKICSSCGGKCCINHSGAYFPEDFKEEITPEFICSLLQTEKVSIDWWDGDVMGNDEDVSYYLRPRHVDGKAIDGSWGGVCVNWDNNGCSLDETKRPYGCRMLIPGKFSCKYKNGDGSKKHSCERWYEYRSIIEKGISLFKYKSISQ